MVAVGGTGVSVAVVFVALAEGAVVATGAVEFVALAAGALAVAGRAVLTPGPLVAGATLVPGVVVVANPGVPTCAVSVSLAASLVVLLELSAMLSLLRDVNVNSAHAPTAVSATTPSTSATARIF